MIRALVTAALAGAIATLALASSGCDVSSYCVNCATGDGGVGDGGIGDGGGTPDVAVIDAGPPGDACVPSGVEVCDDLDNDCDGEVDEGDLDGVGVTCGTNMGECSEGTTECVAGAIVCGGSYVAPVPELCDNLDNDCDGTADNGDPEGGGICGTDQGECQAGIRRCIDGDIECVGEVQGSTEVCDTRDNDCDGNFDEMIPVGGSCGPAEGNTGLCQTGQEECIGGEMQCVGAVYPTLEQCDNMDHDCDGNDTNGFDLVNNARTCGGCNIDCTDDFVPTDNVASVRCNTGMCEIAACEDDYYDNDDLYSTGCEDFCDTFTGPQEACNDSDDDCDGDVDEDVIAPQACDSNGMNCRDVCDLPGTPCAGGASMCVNGAWVCTGWPAEVETDVDGNLIETLCDDFDNDCDGLPDENFPAKGGQCFDNGLGICRREGTFDCNTAGTDLECVNLSPPVSATTETCNGLDDDCMGDVDEGFDDGSNQPWVDIGDGVEILPYEMSRPDASAGDGGTLSEDHACSVAGVKPWTNVNAATAEAICNRINARLCTEAEWQRACMTVGESYPQGTGSNRLVVIEAEDFHATTAVVQTDNGSNDWTYRWVPVPQPGFSGASAMWVSPDSDIQVTDNSGPRMDYRINFNQSGTHYVWLRVNDWNGVDDRVHVGINGAISATGNTMGRFGTGWSWHNRNSSNQVVTINVPSAGVHTFNIWQRDEAAIVDKILLTTSSSYTPLSTGPITDACYWGFSASCQTYQPTVCNGDDYDTNPGLAGDQDDILPTGSLAGCYADWGAAGRLYDMSGNVKELTAPRGANQNPLRGGASNNAAGGIACKASFGVVDDNFAFPNVGFRCCRDAP